MELIELANALSRAMSVFDDMVAHENLEALCDLEESELDQIVKKYVDRYFENEEKA